MLHILLLILKIIGILLAALLGIVLLVLIGVLFVPVRYRIEAKGKLGDEQPIYAKVKISWLLHIINIVFAYPEAAYIKVRVFCFTVFDSSREKKRDAKKERKKPLSEDEEIIAQGTGEEKKPETEETEDNKRKENTTEENKEENKIEESKTKQNEAKRNGEVLTEAPKSGIWKKIKAFYLLLRRLFYQFIASLKNIEYTIRKICDRIKKIIGNIQYYAEVLKSEVFRSAWAASKRQLLRTLRMLRPDRCRINLLAGTGDPAGTGQLLAFYGILYPFIGNCVLIEADFENKVFEGDLFMKGGVRVFVFLLAALKLFMDKNIRRLLKLLKKEDM